LPFKNSDESLPVNSFSSSNTLEIKWKMNLQILYVEDVTTNQFVIEEILGDWGIKVVMASDGFEALKLIEEKIYDLILMDIQMPGIDGLETARRIRAMDDPYFKNVPILALTASTSGSIGDKIMDSGMQDFIIKPINVDELRAKIIEHTSIVDEFNEQDNLVEESEEEEKETPIIFERTDQLFISNLIKYQEFLKMTIDEFKINLELLTISIKDEDLLQYRQLRHRMKSLIVTFGMKELLKLLNEIKDKFIAGSLSSKEKKEFIKSLKRHVNFLIDCLANKLASLKWQ
jgi:CheY-like chemotaxis protein